MKLLAAKSAIRIIKGIGNRSNCREVGVGKKVSRILRDLKFHFRWPEEEGGRKNGEFGAGKKDDLRKKATRIQLHSNRLINNNFNQKRKQF